MANQILTRTQSGLLQTCYSIGIFVVTLSAVTLSANFAVTLSEPILLHYRAILLHYQLVITLLLNLELHYRLMLQYRALLHYRA